MSATVLNDQNLRKSEKFAIIASKGGATMASKYDSMSKEELVAAMKARNKSYKWQKACVLTPAEGEKLETKILPLYGCTNVSQLVKKIVNDELIISTSESNS